MTQYFHDALNEKRRLINELIYRRIDLTVSPKTFFNEFRIMRMDLGRCMGHTTFIKEAVRTGDLIVVPSKVRSASYPYPIPGVRIIEGKDVLWLGGNRFEGTTVFLDQCGRDGKEYHQLMHVFNNYSFPDLFVVLQ